MVILKLIGLQSLKTLLKKEKEVNINFSNVFK